MWNVRNFCMGIRLSGKDARHWWYEIEDPQCHFDHFLRTPRCSQIVIVGVSATHATRNKWNAYWGFVKVNKLVLSAQPYFTHLGSTCLTPHISKKTWWKFAKRHPTYNLKFFFIIPILVKNMLFSAEKIMPKS